MSTFCLRRSFLPMEVTSAGAAQAICCLVGAVILECTPRPISILASQQTATITVLASPEQAMLLTRYENEGVLHVALINRGNDTLSNELLKRQDEILTALYAEVPEEDLGETEDGTAAGTETSE